MNRPRLKLTVVMISLGVIAANMALVRAFVVAKMFFGSILLLVMLQVGLVGLLRTRGRSGRCFWLGFEVAGCIAAILAISCEVLLGDAWAYFLMPPTVSVVEFLKPRIGWTSTAFFLEHERWFLFVFMFLFELLFATMGGCRRWLFSSPANGSS